MSKKIVMTCMFMTASWLCPKDEPVSSPLSLMESIAVGGVVGAAEVALPGQIFSYGMNQAIKGKKFVWADAYKGGVVNALGQAPITAVQKVVQVKGSRAIELAQGSELSDAQKVGVSYAAGVAGAVIDTPSNAVQLCMQNETQGKKTMMQAMCHLKEKCHRGFVANAFLKEGLFAVGYQALAPKGQEIAKGYVGDNIAAVAIGGAAAGVVTAVATQPGAVIRNKMQNDPFATTSTMQTAKNIFVSEGMKGFFSGLKQRGARVAIAVPLYVAYGTMLENWIKKRG